MELPSAPLSSSSKKNNSYISSYISVIGTFLYSKKRKPQKLSYISGGTSKAPKTRISFISQKKNMNKYF